MRAENNERLAKEDFIRNFHVELYKVEKCVGDYDMDLLDKTWGNCETIQEFIDYARGLNREEDAYTLLNNLTDKDLRDVSIDVLKDCFDNNMLNPRVSNEMLRPFVKTFHETSLPNNVDDLTQWVRDSIEIRDDLNVRQIPMSPAGVMRSRVTDSHSRDIFFVAMARVKGITSRIDPVTGKVQYFDNQWIDVSFNIIIDNNNQFGKLIIDYQGLDDPRYYTHFSIKKFNGNTFDLLAYDAMDPGMDVGMTLSQMMADDGIMLDPGYYVLSCGPRLADGSVLNHLVFFTIEEGKTTEIELVMRTAASLQNGERIVAYLDGGSEPTTHAMQDISIIKEEFEKWGGEITFFFKNEEDFSSFKLKKFNDLPHNVEFEVNSGLAFDTLNNLPCFLVLNSENEVVFEKSGYQIGLGEQLLHCLK